MSNAEIQILLAGIRATLPSRTDRACVNGWLEVRYPSFFQWLFMKYPKLIWHNCLFHPNAIHRTSEHKKEKSNK